jgi:hypothetical protein
MQDRRWATGRDGRGGRLFEYILVTIISLGLTLAVVQMAVGLISGPMAQAASVLHRAAGGG